MALNGSLGLVSFAFALVDNLLEEKGAECKDADYGPDLQRRLGAWGGYVRWGLVGARGFAWLAEARGVDGGRGESADAEQLRLVGEDALASKDRGHGGDKAVCIHGHCCCCCAN